MMELSTNRQAPSQLSPSSCVAGLAVCVVVAIVRLSAMSPSRARPRLVLSVIVRLISHFCQRLGLDL